MGCCQSGREEEVCCERKDEFCGVHARRLRNGRDDENTEGIWEGLQGDWTAEVQKVGTKEKLCKAWCAVYCKQEANTERLFETYCVSAVASSTMSVER